MPNAETAPAVTLTPKSAKNASKFSVSAISLHLSSGLGLCHLSRCSNSATHTQQVIRHLGVKVVDVALFKVLLLRTAGASNQNTHKEKGGRLPGPASYQVVTSRMAAKLSACRTATS